jgi:pteridine reductase|tara:strand:- start:137 stop:889 length:753 start_codon:yes stop_codon:yes gene_type:complete
MTMVNADTKVALVTGGAQRIGARLCQALHEAGYDIALHYRSSGVAAEALAAQLSVLRPRSVTCFQAALGDRSAGEELAAGVIDHLGRIDLLVNNASTFYPTPIGSVGEEDWETIIGSNLKGPFFLCQALADSLKQSRGNIINVIDIHGERPLADHSLYSTAKAGLAMLTRSLARELAPDVRVNGISPGVILWPKSDDPEDGERRERQLKRVPLGSEGDPQDIAEAVLFLAERAPYVTGQIIAVDGGRSLT